MIILIFIMNTTLCVHFYRKCIRFSSGSSIKITHFLLLWEDLSKSPITYNMGPKVLKFLLLGFCWSDFFQVFYCRYLKQNSIRLWSSSGGYFRGLEDSQTLKIKSRKMCIKNLVIKTASPILITFASII